MEAFIDGIADAFSSPQSFSDLWARVLAIAADPSSNTPAAALLAAIALMLVVLVVLLLVFLFSGKREIEYVYMDIDDLDTASHEVVEVIEAPIAPVPHRTASSEYRPSDSAVTSASPDGQAADHATHARVRRLSVPVIAFILILLAYLAGVAVAGLDTTCLSCHGGTSHTTLGDEATHGRVRCVSCHERSDFLTLVTLEHPSRLAHAVSMGFADEGDSTYGATTNISCEGCHRSVTRSVHDIPQRSLRISHPEFLAAGASCTDCHTLEVDGVVGHNTTGMAECLRCHDDETASAACETCHTGADVSEAASGRLSRGHEPHGVVPSPQCYTCHDPEPCDACHGMRLPHPVGYAADHMYDAAKDFWATGGEACGSCHPSRARACDSMGCHGTEMPMHGSTQAELARFGARHHVDGGCDDCHNRQRLWTDSCAMCHRDGRVD